MPRARRIRVEGFDEVYRVACGDTVAFVVLHAVIRGVAFGGVRIRPYDSEAHALEDALQLARTMSRKVVMAGIRAGGAKTVVVAPPRERAAAVRAVGEFIESLAGRYLCGDDLGFSHDDGVVLRQATRYVACSGLAGQTARGVLIAMNAVCVPRVVVIQGLGAVGRPLAEALEAAGARVTVSDVRAVQGFRTVSPDDVYDEPCDVFVPCATGGLLDARTVPRLRCRVVCSGANNPLASDACADLIHGRHIVYVPDFIANAGAVIHGASRALGEADRIEERMNGIGTTARAIVEHATRARRSPHHVAVALADRRVVDLRRDR